MKCDDAQAAGDSPHPFGEDIEGFGNQARMVEHFTHENEKRDGGKAELGEGVKDTDGELGQTIDSSHKEIDSSRSNEKKGEGDREP
jgi:hypothetical protein